METVSKGSTTTILYGLIVAVICLIKDGRTEKALEVLESMKAFVEDR